MRLFSPNPSQPQDSLLPRVKHSVLITHLTATAFQSIQDQRYQLLLSPLSTPVLRSLSGMSCKCPRKILLRASILHLWKRQEQTSPAKDRINPHSRSDLTCWAAAAHSSPPQCGKTVPTHAFLPPLTAPAPFPYQVV